MQDEQGSSGTPKHNHGMSVPPSESKGVIARKIISLARRNGVPVHEDRNLVEVLSTIDLSGEIPTELYKAVSEMLVFVYQAGLKL